MEVLRDLKKEDWVWTNDTFQKFVNHDLMLQEEEIVSLILSNEQIDEFYGKLVYVKCENSDSIDEESNLKPFAE